MIRFLFSLAAMFPTAMLRGYVIQKLWLWFLVPLGLPTIGVAHAIGISILIGALTFQFVVSPFETLEGWTKTITLIVAGTLANLMIWGMGAIVHSFM